MYEHLFISTNILHLQLIFAYRQNHGVADEVAPVDVVLVVVVVVRFVVRVLVVVMAELVWGVLILVVVVHFVVQVLVVVHFVVHVLVLVSNWMLLIRLESLTRVRAGFLSR